MTVLDATDAPSAAAAAPAQLAVAWQRPDGGLIEPVGLLACEDGGFRFDYLARAADLPGFQPFLGFPDLQRTYRSQHLFPLFSQRVMRPRRPDYPSYVAMLGLQGQPPEWELLARSTGQRQGDAIRVFAEPRVTADGATEATFFVSGVRHRLGEDPVSVERALAGLRPGDRLTLRAEPTNRVDPRALHVVEAGGVAVGWIPNVLLDHLHDIAEPDVRVQQVSGGDVVPSYRLLVRSTGTSGSGARPFDGPQWRLASEQAMA